MESAIGTHHSKSEHVAAYLRGVMQSNEQSCKILTENIWRDGLFLFSPVHVMPFTVLELWLWLPSSDEPIYVLASTRYVEKLEVGFGLGALISAMSTAEQRRWDEYYGQRLQHFKETSREIAKPLSEGRKVLVMEQALSAPLVKMLQGKGFVVQRAVDADEQAMLCRAGQGEIDLVIAEMNTPQQEGLALCRSLRQSNPELPVLLLSQSGDEQEFLAGADAGAAHVVAKRCSGEILVSRIETMVDNAQAARSASQSLSAVQALNLEDSLTFSPTEPGTLQLVWRKLSSRLSGWMGATRRHFKSSPQALSAASSLN